MEGVRSANGAHLLSDTLSLSFCVCVSFISQVFNPATLGFFSFLSERHEPLQRDN